MLTETARVIFNAEIFVDCREHLWRLLKEHRAPSTPADGPVSSALRRILCAEVLGTVRFK